MTEDADWTGGVEAILYQRCTACGGAWYFRRSFCPHCGASPVETCRASGRAVIRAATRVERAPSAAWRDLVPYTLVLADAEEGFRLMAHAAPDVVLRDAVVASFQRLGGRLLPYFIRRAPAGAASALARPA